MFLEENGKHSDNQDSRKPERGGELAERQRKAKITMPGHQHPKGWFPRLPEAGSSCDLPCAQSHGELLLAPFGPACALCDQPLLGLVLLGEGGGRSGEMYGRFRENLLEMEQEQG